MWVEICPKMGIFWQKIELLARMSFKPKWRMISKFWSIGPSSHLLWWVSQKIKTLIQKMVVEIDFEYGPKSCMKSLKSVNFEEKSRKFLGSDFFPTFIYLWYTFILIMILMCKMGLEGGVVPLKALFPLPRGAKDKNSKY